MKVFVAAALLWLPVLSHAVVIYEYEGSSPLVAILRLNDSYVPGTATNRFEDFLSFTVVNDEGVATLYADNLLLPPPQGIPQDEFGPRFFFDPTSYSLGICCDFDDYVVAITPLPQSIYPLTSFRSEYWFTMPADGVGDGGTFRLVGPMTGVAEPATLWLLLAAVALLWRSRMRQRPTTALHVRTA